MKRYIAVFIPMPDDVPYRETEKEFRFSPGTPEDEMKRKVWKYANENNLAVLRLVHQPAKRHKDVNYS